MKVRGLHDADGAPSAAVLRGRFADRARRRGSPLTLTATNGAGKTLSPRSSSKSQTGHTDGRGGPSPVVGFEGTVPADVGHRASGSCRRGKVVARRDRSAHAPKVRVLSPKKSSVVGKQETVLVRGRRRTPTKTPVTIAIDYSRNAGKTWHRIYEGPNRGGPCGCRRTTSPTPGRPGVRITADDGFNQTAASSPVFRVARRQAGRADPRAHEGRRSRPQDATLAAPGPRLRRHRQAADEEAPPLARGQARARPRREHRAPRRARRPGAEIRLEAKDSSGRIGRATVYVRLTRGAAVVQQGHGAEEDLAQGQVRHAQGRPPRWRSA